jgi:Flp pilus assembly pilin Flp
MTRIFKKYRRDESGAVTVDWVVLTAALVGLGVGVIAVIAQGATDKSTGLGAHLSNQSIQSF